MVHVENVAVYWDFENIHASLVDAKEGQGAYRRNRYTRQREEVDIDAIMEYVTSLGNININKAYGNWQSFATYSDRLQRHSIDLMQLFHRGAHGKNGADIRLAIDIMEDIAHGRHISVIIVVGGDSDYVAIAQKVRQSGRKIVGIGVRESTNQYWIQSCNEFKFYATLLVKASSPRAQEIELVAPDDESSIGDAKELLVRAVKALSQEAGGGAILVSNVKTMMMRLDSAFDEANFGFSKFSKFLEACGDVVIVSKGEKALVIELREIEQSAKRTRPPEKELDSPYEKILRRTGIRPIESKLMEVGLEEVFVLFSRHNGVLSDFEVFKVELLKRLRERLPTIDSTDIAKLKQLLFAARVFRLTTEPKSVALITEIGSGGDLLERVRRAITQRVLDNTQGQPELVELRKLLFSFDPGQNKTRALVEQVSDLG